MKTKNWKSCVIQEDAKLIDAVKVLNDAALQIILVVSSQNKFVGVVTDGDFRRALINGLDLNSPVSKVMNKQPTTALMGTAKEDILNLMRAKQIHQIPVIDENGYIQNLYTIDTVLEVKPQENQIVLMAGGLGSRLKELTKDCPKPLLKVGGRPLLETIILNFKQQGFTHFNLCVNYLSDQLKEHFKDGSEFGVNIRYVEEEKRLGTAGALRLANIKSNVPVIVMNGDILTNFDFTQFTQFHLDGKYEATMGTRVFETQIPYGVVNTEDSKVISMQEKPIQKYFINAGIYCFNSDLFSLIPENEYFDMNQFFEKILSQNKKVGSFPISNYWIDIGRFEDYERANVDFPVHFKNIF